MKAPLILAATAVLTVTLAAQADARSTPSELRGYEACLDASTTTLQGVVPDRTYLVDQRDDERTYYINATAWEEGARVNVGFRCQTNLSGRLLSSAEPAYTRYVPASATVQIAGQ